MWRWDCRALASDGRALRAAAAARGTPPAALSTPPLPLLAWVSLDCRYTRDLVLAALASRPGWRVAVASSADEECPADAAFCWAEYERTPFDRVLAGDLHAACYCTRKGLNRKAQFALHAAQHAAKHPTGALAAALPQTLLFEFWDEEYLDEARAATRTRERMRAEQNRRVMKWRMQHLRAHTALTGLSLLPPLLTPPSSHRRPWRRCSRCATCPATGRRLGS